MSYISYSKGLRNPFLIARLAGRYRGVAEVESALRTRRRQVAHS
jgi:hypothetical protein